MPEMDDLRLNAIPTLDPKCSTYSAIWKPLQLDWLPDTLAESYATS